MVDGAAAVLADGWTVIDSVLADIHIDRLPSLQESPDSGDPRLESC